MRYLAILVLLIASSESTGDDFVPKDINQAMAIGCSVSGINDSPPFAEVQVFVKSGTGKGWDYKPIVARYGRAEGGVYKAIDECRKWYAHVEEKMKAAQHDKP